MKNWEVTIIIVAVLIVGYMWWAHSQTQTASPVNAASPGYVYSNVYGQPLGIGPV
jgi:hypothetical protein